MDAARRVVYERLRRDSAFGIVGIGSTEFILGQGFDVQEIESVQMGCVSSTKRFFADATITRKYWREVQQNLASEIAPFRSQYLARSWKRVIGCSGTLKATRLLA